MTFDLIKVTQQWPDVCYNIITACRLSCCETEQFEIILEIAESTGLASNNLLANI